MKLSCTRNSLALDEIRRILVHQQHNQTGVVNKHKNALFTTPVSQIRYLRHRGMFPARTPDRLDAVTAAWHDVGFRLKLSCTENGRVLDEIHRWYPPAPAAQWSLRAVYLSTSMLLFTVVVMKPTETHGRTAGILCKKRTTYKDE